MTKIRLLPVVVMAVAALLVLKTLGLVTNGGYVLTGVGAAQAQDHSPAPAAEHGGDATAVPAEPTMEDTSPTLADPAPTLGEAASQAGHGESATPAADHGEPAADSGEEHGAAPAEGEAAGEAGAPAAQPSPGPAAPEAAAGEAVSETYCVDAQATLTESGVIPMEGDAAVAPSGEHGTTPSETPPAEANPNNFAQSMTVDCLPSGDAVPMQIDEQGNVTPLINSDGTTATEQQVLERLAARRSELEKFEQDLAMRAALVEAAEKRIEERTATLAALEAQISALVDQRQEMESGQFAGIVAMYESMKPKDAANIFNNLEMDVLLRVAKTMSPRKMAPILAEMNATRAQELTVQMAALAERPATEMSPEDLSQLPQIVGQ